MGSALHLQDVIAFLETPIQLNETFAFDMSN